ncbi:MAG: hypothetical protein ACYDHH_23345, partial [Solirubrobacteraceae bacterium]
NVDPVVFDVKPNDAVEEATVLPLAGPDVMLAVGVLTCFTLVTVPPTGLTTQRFERRPWRRAAHLLRAAWWRVCE